MTGNLIRTLLLSAGAASLALAAPALAQDWKAALAAGQIGEKTDGYLAVVGGGNAALRALVDDVNIKRRAVYAQRAQENKSTLEEYAFTIACQQIAKLDSGMKYQAPDGSWQTKGAGAPIRDPRCP
jgi:uncharacterized protein YdbL (DUF1318 family)